MSYSQYINNSLEAFNEFIEDPDNQNICDEHVPLLRDVLTYFTGLRIFLEYTKKLVDVVIITPEIDIVNIVTNKIKESPQCPIKNEVINEIWEACDKWLRENISVKLSDL